MNIRTIQALILGAVIFFGCEDVVEVPLQETAPSLVIEASIEWEKGGQGNDQSIFLTTSQPYFDSSQPNGVVGATVTITNENSGQVFEFSDRNDGSYTTDSFIPVVGNTYVLTVQYQGETIQAAETLIGVVDISQLFQSSEKGSDTDINEINLGFNDPGASRDYYYITVQERGERLPALFHVDDQFSDGNEITLYYEKKEDGDNGITEFTTGDVVDIELHGVSSSYYRYIRTLISQLENGGPFATVPVDLKGNLVNLSNPENAPYGYFRLNQVDTQTYQFE